jgi:hypothetical protein
VPLHNPPTRAPAVFHQTPIGVSFSVFAPFMASQKDCHEQGLYQLPKPAEEGRSALQAGLECSFFVFLGNPKIFERIFLKTGSSCESQARGTRVLVWPGNDSFVTVSGLHIATIEKESRSKPKAT